MLWIPTNSELKDLSSNLRNLLVSKTPPRIRYTMSQEPLFHACLNSHPTQPSHQQEVDYYAVLTRIGPQAPIGFQCLAGCTLAPNRLPLEPISDSKGA
jgi:hypothetical protein